MNIPVAPRHERNTAPNDNWMTHTNIQQDDNVIHQPAMGQAGDRRRTLTEQFENKGLRRPEHAQCNSRS